MLYIRLHDTGKKCRTSMKSDHILCLYHVKDTELTGMGSACASIGSNAPKWRV